MISLFVSTAMTVIAMLLLSTGALAVGQLFTHADLTLRRGPADSFAGLTTIRAGTPITVLWCNGKADWCLVDDGLEQGWAPFADLKNHNSSAMSDPGAGPASIDAGEIPAAAPGADPAGAASASVGSTSVTVSTPAASVSVKLP